ncbi:MAG: hypothetical protein K8R67_18145 [Desulfobacteraceae bacterium]|nr:hypothetical protein [Desulfobacteraceae bacterium]
MYNFSERNKNALITGAVFLLIFFAVVLIFLPAVNKRKDLKRIIHTSKFNLTKMIELRQNYNATGKDVDNNTTLLKKRDKNFSLFSYFDSIAKNCGVKKNVAYMKPSFQDIKGSEYKKAFVKAKLESISLKECVAFLNKIENSKNMVSVNSFSISTTGKDNKMIDIVIETETIMLIN